MHSPKHVPRTRAIDAAHIGVCAVQSAALAVQVACLPVHTVCSVGNALSISGGIEVGILCSGKVQWAGGCGVWKGV